LIFTPTAPEDSHFVIFDEHIFQRGGKKPPSNFFLLAPNFATQKSEDFCFFFVAGIRCDL